MTTHAHVAAGGPAGDFAVIDLGDDGWVVTSHHRDVLNYVPPDADVAANPMPDDVRVGMFGRTNRGTDAERLRAHEAPCSPAWSRFSRKYRRRSWSFG